jgi:ribonuclease E
MGSDAPGSGFAREASDDERAFHAAQNSSGDGGNHEPREPSGGASEPREAREPREPREPRESRESRESREPRPESGSQAPLDLPPPPASKPFVVWSSTPGDSPERRDE